MALSVDDLIDAIHAEDRDPHLRLCGLAIHVADSGSQTREVWARPVSRIEFDDENEELLLFVGEPKFESFGDMPSDMILTVADLAAAVHGQDTRGHITVCVSEEWSSHETEVRIDYPVTGTGENRPCARFFAVVRDEPRQGEG